MCGVWSKKQSGFTRLITHNVSMLSKVVHTTRCYYHKRKQYLLQAKNNLCHNNTNPHINTQTHINKHNTEDEYTK